MFRPSLKRLSSRSSNKSQLSTPLHDIILSGDFEDFLEAMSEYGASLIDTINHEGNTPLHLAIKSQHLEMVQRLIIKLANPHIKNNDHKTAVDFVNALPNCEKANEIRAHIIDHSDFFKNHPDSIAESKRVAVLVEHQKQQMKVASLRGDEEDFSNSFSLDVRLSDLSQADLILETRKQSNPLHNLTTPMSKPSFSYHQNLPIHQAVVNNNYEDFLEALEIMGTKGIDLVDDNRDTALNLAIKHEREEMVNVLIGRFADPTIRNKQILNASLMAFMITSSASIKQSVDEYCERFSQHRSQITQTKKTAIELEKEEWQEVDVPQPRSGDIPSSSVTGQKKIPKTLLEKLAGRESF